MDVVGGLSQSYWPADKSEPLIEGSLGDFLRQVAADVPDRIALVDGVADASDRRRWTYKELLEDSERLARALLSRFSVGEKIAVYMPNCAEWILLQHAIHLAGMVLVPVNPAYEEGELCAVLANAEAVGVFFVDEYRGRDLKQLLRSVQRELPLLRQLLSMSDWSAFQALADSDTVLPQASADDLLQLQFTSGTTGVPKGACLHHQGVINTSRFVALRAGFPEGGVWLNAMPMFHIGGSAVTHLGALTLRGTYVIAPGFDPSQMLALIESERANITLVVPTMILALLDHPDFSKHDLSSMCTVLTGAAEVPAALVTRTKESFDCDLSILFGQTELNGVVCQTSIYDSESDQANTLGQPLPQAEVCIADADTGEIVPIGVAGEILVRGYQNMHAYYGLEEATKATIRDDGWLRMGDTGVMDERGYVKIVGRIKDMLIRGGMNIYPKEIEEVLFGHSAVAQVSVIGVPNEKWGEIVAAVIIPANDQPLPLDDLFAQCRASLAAHKTPEQWFVCDSYPLTPSGKVQKFVLKDWVSEGKISPLVWSKPETARR